MVRRYNNYKYRNPFDLDDMDRSKDSIHSIPFWIGLLFIICLCGIFGIVYLIDGVLPTPLNIEDEESYPSMFISERAVEDLRYLTDLGPKVTGSYENEYVVIDFLMMKINSIIAEAHANQYLELDIQTVTGGYYLDGVVGFMNVYDRVQNVVVKLHGHTNDSEHSILINSHFDSVPTSPGGNDDGINVAIMLEMLRKLSKSDKRQLHNVIFLFNGAEETVLQAAHGYISHHKWAQESKVLINLESAGTGGKIVLFQSGPETPWLLKYYHKVPYPYGNVIAEEIFQSGLIPSDTDFRLFRDFGNMVGFDMAYFRNGYRYHTKYDGFSNIPRGSYQHGGDNALSLVKSLANAPEVLEQGSTPGKTIYFDVFGWFMISYMDQTAVIVNLIVIILSFGAFIISVINFRTGMAKKTIQYFMFTLLAIIASWILTVMFVIGLAYLLDVLNKTMSWYGSPWFVLGLYLVPVISFSGCLMFITDHKNLSLGVRSQLQAHLVRILWTLFLILGTILNIRSVYFIMIPVLFTSSGFLIIHLFRLQHTVRTWQIIYVISLIIPIAYLTYLGWISLLTFIPITGRLGSDTNPEIHIGLICLIFALLAVSQLSVLSNLLRQALWYYLILLATFLIFFGLLFSPLGFPYSGNDESPTPQRQWIMHTQRQFFDESFSIIREDSGFLMDTMDRNSPNILKPYVKELGNIASLNEDCENYSFCAVPFIHAKVLQRAPYSIWIPTSSPDFPDNETLRFVLVSKNIVSSTQVNYSVQVSGPDKLAFYITPKPNIRLASTSLMHFVESTKFRFQDRPVYVISYQLGKSDGTPLKFDFTMEVPVGHKGPTVDLTVSGRYVHEKRIKKTEAYLKFLNQFPDWTHVIAWVASQQQFVL